MTRIRVRRRRKAPKNTVLPTTFQDAYQSFHSTSTRLLGIFPGNNNDFRKRPTYAFSKDDDGKPRNDLFSRWGRRISNEFRFQLLYHKILWFMCTLIVLRVLSSSTTTMFINLPRTHKLVPLLSTTMTSFYTPLSSFAAFFHDDNGELENDNEQECWDGEPRKGFGTDRPVAGSLSEADVVVTFNGFLYDPDAVTLMTVGEINEITLKSNNHFFHGFEVRVMSLLHGHFQLLLGESTTAGTSASACYSANSAALSDVNHDIYMDETSVILIIDSGHEDICVEISVLIDDPYAGDGTDQAWYSTYFGNNIVFDEVQEETDRLLQLYNSTFNATDDLLQNFTYFPNSTDYPTSNATSAPSEGPVANVEDDDFPQSDDEKNDKSGVSSAAIIGSVVPAGLVIGALVAAYFLISERNRRNAASGSGSAPTSPPVREVPTPPPHIDTVIASLMYPNRNPVDVDPDVVPSEYYPSFDDPSQTMVPPNPLSTNPIPPASASSQSTSLEHLQYIPDYKDQTRTVSPLVRKPVDPLLFTAEAIVEEEQQASATSAQRKVLDP